MKHDELGLQSISVDGPFSGRQMMAIFRCVLRREDMEDIDLTVGGVVDAINELTAGAAEKKPRKRYARKPREEKIEAKPEEKKEEKKGRRGRPKGSKNRPKFDPPDETNDTEDEDLPPMQEFFNDVPVGASATGEEE